MSQSYLKEVCKISTRSVHSFLRNRAHGLQKYSFEKNPFKTKDDL